MQLWFAGIVTINLTGKIFDTCLKPQIDRERVIPLRHPLSGAFPTLIPYQSTPNHRNAKPDAKPHPLRLFYFLF